MGSHRNPWIMQLICMAPRSTRRAPTAGKEQDRNTRLHEKSFAIMFSILFAILAVVFTLGLAFVLALQVRAKRYGKASPSAGPLADLSQLCTGLGANDSCHEAIREVQRGIDLDADPCGDFHQYACGRWRPLLGGDGSYISRTTNLFNGLVHDTLLNVSFDIREGKPAPYGPSIHQMAMFHASCYWMFTGRNSGGNVIDVMAALGIEQMSWIAVASAERLFELTVSMSLRTGLSAFVDVRLLKGEVHFDIGSPLVKTFVYKPGLRQYLVDTVIDLDVNISDPVQKTLDLDHKVDSLIHDSSESSVFRTLTVKELVDLFPQVNWISAFNTDRPTALGNVTNGTTIALRGVTFIKETLQVFHEEQLPVIGLYGLLSALSKVMKLSYYAHYVSFDQPFMGVRWCLRQTAWQFRNLFPAWLASSFLQSSSTARFVKAFNETMEVVLRDNVVNFGVYLESTFLSRTWLNIIGEPSNVLATSTEPLPAAMNDTFLPNMAAVIAARVGTADREEVFVESDALVLGRLGYGERREAKFAIPPALVASRGFLSLQVPEVDVGMFALRYLILRAIYERAATYQDAGVPAASKRAVGITSMPDYVLSCFGQSFRKSLNKSLDEDVTHDAEPSSEPERPLESPSLPGVREMSALQDLSDQAENQLPKDSAAPKEEMGVLSEEQPQYSSIAPEYNAEMTPFQSKVVNMTLCCSASVIGVAALIILVLALTHQAKRLGDGSQGCKSQQCLDATLYLRSVVEQDLHPCVDMYSHVCSRWTSRRRGVGFVPDALHLFLQRFRRRLQSSFDDVLGDRMAPVIRIGKRLLDDCTAYMNATGSSLRRDLESVLEQVNVTVLLESDSHSTALVRAINISFATGLHSAVVVARRKDERSTFLHLTNAPPIRRELRAAPTDDDVEAYVVDVIRHLNVTSDAVDIAREVFDVDSEVDTFAEGDVKSVRLSAGELRIDAGFPSGVWKQAFGAFTDQGLAVTDVDVLLFTGYEQTREVFQHLAQAQLRTTTWYLLITILAQALQYDFARRFHPTGGQDTGNLCFDAVNAALHLHWHLVLRGVDVTHPAAGIGQLNSMFFNVHRITIPDWLDEETAALARRRVNKTSLETLAPSAGDGDVNNANTTYLQRVPQQSSAVKSDRSFPGSYVAFRALSQREGMLHNPPHWVTARMASLWADPWPVYDALYDKIFLPAAYLDSPVFYNERTTPPFLYGTVGAALAKALADVIGPYGRWNATSPHRSQVSWWTVPKLFDAQLRLGCLRTRADEDVLRHPNRNPHPKTSEAFKSSAFAWIRAARVAHDAMRSAIYNDRGEGSAQDPYWPKAQRQFFSRFCLMACGTERRDALKPWERCTWPLLSMPEFATAFDCRNASYNDLRESCAPF
ncbi:uncharacterized protein [Dermacentor albipictus]|uniref:uncharacterized protein isoform X3 n=1 Tax=Dermacentor albipictus TaxID=60249 RepID=UPI0038FC7259